MNKQIKSATKADVDLVNSIEVPTRGVHAGGGIHVDIPADWAARIANGEDVPGCTYARAQADGSLIIDDAVQAELRKPGKEFLACAWIPLAASTAAADAALNTPGGYGPAGIV